LTTALLTVFLAWLGLSTWVVVNRIAYERLVAGVRRGSKHHRLRWRAMAQLAADSSSDPELADALTRYVLETDERRVVDKALDPRGGWRGIQAVRILARAHHPQTLPALERMLSSGNEDVRAAAVTVLGDMEGEQATALLITALRTGACPPRWASATLDRRTIRMEMLETLLDEATPEVRAVATQLLGRVDPSDAKADEILLRLCGDPDADVRAAACGALGQRGGTRAIERITPMLRDHMWFVRVRAARALGRLGDVGSAGAIAELLESPFWWVRQAAKDALVDLGPSVKDQLVPWLDHRDAFARNSSAEILQNLGVVDDLVAEVKESSDPARAAAATVLLRKILAAGGDRVVDAVNEGSGSAIGEALADPAVDESPADKMQAA